MKNPISIKVIKRGNPGCNHRWSPYVYVLDMLPPIRHYECEDCGRVEARTDEREAVYIKL
jgi:hypothetical protein